MDFVFGLVDSDSVFFLGGGGFKFHDHSRQLFFSVKFIGTKSHLSS